MAASWNDYNDAQQNAALIPKGTLAKVRLTIRPGGFDDASQGWAGGYATRGLQAALDKSDLQTLYAQTDSANSSRFLAMVARGARGGSIRLAAPQ